jgi:hypothetical protein
VVVIGAKAPPCVKDPPPPELALPKFVGVGLKFPDADAVGFKPVDESAIIFSPYMTKVI